MHEIDALARPAVVILATALVAWGVGVMVWATTASIMDLRAERQWMDRRSARALVDLGRITATTPFRVFRVCDDCLMSVCHAVRDAGLTRPRHRYAEVRACESCRIRTATWEVEV